VSDESSIEIPENQQEPEATESDEASPGASEPYVDKEMAEEYGWKPHQERESKLYL